MTRHQNGLGKADAIALWGVVIGVVWFGFLCLAMLATATWFMFAFVVLGGDPSTARILGGFTGGAVCGVIAFVLGTIAFDVREGRRHA